MIKIGPAGGLSTGKAWDEGGPDGIAQIFVSHGENINSLQFQYVENGTLVLSEKHGGGGNAAKFSVVRLGYPSEFLTGISGYYGSDICSLAFITNKRTYGPFGGGAGNTGRAFEYKLGEENKFAGFHGTAGMYYRSELYWGLYEADDDSDKCKRS